MFKQTEKDIELKRKISAMLAYYKLVYIEKLTKTKSYDTFKMLNGEEYLNRVVSANKEGIISLDRKNDLFLKSLFEHLEDLTTQNISFSPVERDNFSSLEWLVEMLEEEMIKYDMTLVDTMFDSASHEVYQKLVEENLQDSYNTNRTDNMKTTGNNIMKLTKKLNNNDK